MINIFTIEIRIHLSQTRPDTMHTRHLVSKKGEKWLKGGYSDRGYSDNHCKRPLYSMYSFWFHFYCFVDSVVFFTSSGTSLQWSHRLLAGYLQCKVKTDALHGASVFHMERFRGYCYVWRVF